MLRGYKLPEYDFKINALEAGMILGFLIKYNLLETARKELPTLTKKADKLTEEIYKNQYGTKRTKKV